EAPGDRFRRLCRKHPAKPGGKPGFSPKTPGFWGGRPSRPRDFQEMDGSRRLGSDRNPMMAGFKSHQVATGCRDHSHAETGPGVSLGAADRLGEIVERAMHVERPVADAQQNGGTLGMG